MYVCNTNFPFTSVILRININMTLQFKNMSSNMVGQNEANMLTQ